MKLCQYNSHTICEWTHHCLMHKYIYYVINLHLNKTKTPKMWNSTHTFFRVFIWIKIIILFIRQFVYMIHSIKEKYIIIILSIVNSKLILMIMMFHLYTYKRCNIIIKMIMIMMIVMGIHLINSDGNWFFFYVYYTHVQYI